jgi:hypothetical protein
MENNKTNNETGSLYPISDWDRELTRFPRVRATPEVP